MLCSFWTWKVVSKYVLHNRLSFSRVLQSIWLISSKWTNFLHQRSRSQFICQSTAQCSMIFCYRWDSGYISSPFICIIWPILIKFISCPMWFTCCSLFLQINSQRRCTHEMFLFRILAIRIRACILMWRLSKLFRRKIRNKSILCWISLLLCMVQTVCLW